MRFEHGPTTVYDDESDEDVVLPMCWEICGDCRGDGVRALGGLEITGEVWSDWDDDEREAYLTGGYDQLCISCDGAGKVRGVDVDVLSPRQAELWERERQAVWESRLADRMERLMGA